MSIDDKCSFSAVVGGVCSYDPRDRRKLTKLIPLHSCKKDITGHKSLWSIGDVTSEVELILARASIFSSKKHGKISSYTICPSHRASLGVGWRRGSNRCRVPEELSEHKHGQTRSAKQWPRAERGLGKAASSLILKKTGIFLPVGTGN